MAKTLESFDGGVVITGAQAIEHARWLAVRRALKLEIEVGLKRRGAHTTAQLANAITGGVSKDKRAAYAALNKKIAAEVPGQADVPLRPAKPRKS